MLRMKWTLWLILIFTFTFNDFMSQQGTILAGQDQLQALFQGYSGHQPNEASGTCLAGRPLPAERGLRSHHWRRSWSYTHIQVLALWPAPDVTISYALTSGWMLLSLTVPGSSGHLLQCHVPPSFLPHVTWPLSFIYHNVFKAHPCWSRYFIPF